MEYTTYIRDKITKLRMSKGISEYKMSLDLGQNRNYIQGISSEKALPSMRQFLNIWEYFGITPMQLFDSQSEHLQLVRMAMDEMNSLNEDDLNMILSLIKRLKGWDGKMY